MQTTEIAVATDEQERIMPFCLEAHISATRIPTDFIIYYEAEFLGIFVGQGDSFSRELTVAGHAKLQ
jgi:hypothetical protein